MSIHDQRNGDLRATLAISQYEATYGTTRLLTLPGGRQITVTVPPGTTNGREIRLEGQGQPINGYMGVLILTVAVAPAENMGSQPYPQQGDDFATEFSALPPPPPPPAPIQPASAYPGFQQGGNITNYPAQPQSFPQGTPLSNYYNSPASGQQPPLQTIQSAHGTPAPPTPSYSSAAGYTPTYPQGTPLPPSMSQPSQHRAPILAIILILLVLLIVGGSILIYYTAVYAPQQAQVQQTATALHQTEETTNSYATGTAQVTATAKAQATATATAIASYQRQYDQMIHTTPVLDDALNGPGKGDWDAGSECSFKNGVYHTTETQKDYFLYCTAKATNYSNFGYQVEMNIISGDKGGLIFRADTSSSNTKFYRFGVGKDGSYDVYLYPDNNGDHAKKLADGTSPLVNQGLNQTNIIAVMARGNTFYLYINDKYVDTVKDSDSQLTSGQVGLISDYLKSTTEVVYKNAKVWNLSA